MSKSLCVEICEPSYIHKYWIFPTKEPLSFDEQYGVSKIKIGEDLHNPVPVMDGHNVVAIQSDKDYSDVRYIELIYEK